ncbi:hypothetical protein Taro_011500 [Colocasia esculenta]|uniref:Uncharacterized protein n=1 Tax=Colocasia esculenta TaxID=4460 RepID=A0A843U1M9_COLES|nr:hypothetical protein [Colocasia esculenta]
MCLRFACEAYSLGSGFAVCLACSGVVADLYHQQLSSRCVQCELYSVRVCPRYEHMYFLVSYTIVDVFYILTGHFCEISLAKLWSDRKRWTWIWSLIGHKYPRS